VTNDKKQPGLPVVEVDQAFPLMTTDGVSRPATSTGSTGDQGPAVSAAIRDVLGWRPRVQDPKAFTAALSASFELSTVEDHVVARYVPRGVAVQADLGGVTGGQASLYLRAKAAHEQITRLLDSLQPLRTDADPQDCEAYRGLVRDSVRRIVMEMGREGGPRVALVDSAFGVLTGYQPKPGTSPVFVPGAPPITSGGILNVIRPPATMGLSTGQLGLIPTATAEIDPDTVPGQLGALRDRFGLDDDHVNTVDEEKQRTSFWTLVELVTDLQRSWDLRRSDFTLGAGNGFLGTDLVQISRLLAAASEQVDELEAVLDSVLVSGAERQTVVLDRSSGLTLDDLVQWLRVFVTEDGPNIIRDTGRDGLVSSFTPTAIDLLRTLRNELVRRLIPCGGPSCATGCHCGSRGQVSCIPLGCCTPLPPGLYAGRVKIAVSTLCGLIERLTAKAIRIGRFAGVVLLDLSVVPFDDAPDDPTLSGSGKDFVRVDVRGLHLRPTYLPAFVADKGNPANFGSLVLPLQGSASADDDHLSGIFQRGVLPQALLEVLNRPGNRGILLAASEVPLAVVDGELGRVVQGPAVTTWPRLQPAGVVADDGGPDTWDEIPPNQRFVPQSPPESPPDPADPEVEDHECLDECGDDCAGCDCDCHPFQALIKGYRRVRRVMNDDEVRDAADDVGADLPAGIRGEIVRLLKFVKSDDLGRLVDAIADADCHDAEVQAAEAKQAALLQTLEARRDAAFAAAQRAVEDFQHAEADLNSHRTGERSDSQSAAEPQATAERSDSESAAEPQATAERSDSESAAEPQAAAERTVAEKAAGRAVAEEAAGRAVAEEATAEEEVAEGEVAEGEVTETESAKTEVPVTYARSEEELSALERLDEVVAGQSGRLRTRVGQIQDSAEILRFAVAALRAFRAARTVSEPRSNERGQ
jgi:hypothetical protein